MLIAYCYSKIRQNFTVIGYTLFVNIAIYVYNYSFCIV